MSLTVCLWLFVAMSRWRQAGCLSYVALGSNLGNSADFLREAIRRLEQLSEVPLVRSSIWETTPVDCPPGSPQFLNAVVELAPKPYETPESLLGKLQQLENEFGRLPKKVLNEPRPLDLDLITFGNEIRSSARLILPHPRAHLRKFVLAPLAEIAPSLILPGQTQTVLELFNGLTSDETIRKWE